MAEKQNDLTELAQKYEELYGKKPSPKARPQYLERKIEEKLAIQKQDELQKEEDEKEQEQPIVQTQKVKDVNKEKFVFNGVEYDHRQGKLYGVIFKGQVRYFSEQSVKAIEKDPKLFAAFSLPEGSTYKLSQKKRGA